MGRSRTLSIRAVELVLVALFGGAIALGGAALFGKLGSQTTIQQVSPLVVLQRGQCEVIDDEQIGLGEPR